MKTLGIIGIILCILYAASKEAMGETQLESIESVLVLFVISVILLFLAAISFKRAKSEICRSNFTNWLLDKSSFTKFLNFLNDFGSLVSWLLFKSNSFKLFNLNAFYSKEPQNVDFTIAIINLCGYFIDWRWF